MQNKLPKHRVSLPFELLKTFTEKELNSFEKLISCGYLSSKQGLHRLLKSLKKHALDHAEFSPLIQCNVYNNLVEKEEAKDALNNKQKNKLSKLMNELLHVAEKFLMFEKIKGSEEHDYLLLYPELIDRKQLLLYSKRLNATEKKLSEQKKRGIEYYTKNHDIEEEKVRLLYLTNSLAKKDNYDVYEYYKDVKYILEKINLYLVKKTMSSLYKNKKLDLMPFNAIKNLLDLPQYSNNPLIQLALLNIDLIEKDNDKTFRNLLNKLTEKVGIISASYLKPFYTNLNNYCIRQEYKGRLEFTKYLFEIYKDLHKNNLLLNNDSIDIVLLKNTITYACRVNKFEWAKEQLAYYINYVSKTIRDDVFNYNRAIIAFNEQNFDDALKLLSQVKKIDLIHDLSLRMTQLMCFYETDLHCENSTQQIINSFKEFIKGNNKMGFKLQISYSNFLLIFSKLYKFKDTPGKRNQQIIIKSKLPKIKEQLLQYDFVREKKWLLNKIEVLESLLT